MAGRMRNVVALYMTQDAIPAAGTYTQAFTATMAFIIVDIIANTRATGNAGASTVQPRRATNALTAAAMNTPRTANANDHAGTLVNAQKTVAVGNVVDFVVTDADNTALLDVTYLGVIGDANLSQSL